MRIVEPKPFRASIVPGGVYGGEACSPATRGCEKTFGFFTAPQTVDKARFNKGKRAISMSRREKYEATSLLMF